MRSSGVKSSLWSLISIIVIAGMILGWARANEVKSLGDVWNYASAWSDKLSSCYSDTEALTWDCSEEANPSGEGKDEPSGPVEISEKEYTEYEKKLNSLSVADRKRVDYNRAQWVHWSDLDGNGCNTRQDVLIKQGKKVKTDPNDKCKAVSGKWTSIYDGKEFTTPGGLDIDHVIPLYYAASQGGQSWSADKKKQFANDTSHLIAVSAKSNRSKSDKGPGAYMPPEVQSWCQYSIIWIDTAKKYDLSIEKKDKAKLEEGLATC